MPTDMLSEVEQVKSIVAKYFPIYDVRVSYQVLSIFITPDQTTLEQRFDELRREMNEKKYIPFLNYKGGEYTLTVVRKEERKTRGLWLNIAFLAVTMVTMVLAGAALWASYDDSGDWLAPNNLLWGTITFTLPLLAILGVHELSHYFMAKKHGVSASLPFFIPSIPPLGTMGAFISLRDPMPNRKALIEIGIAGPIGGLLVTLPIAAIGLWLTSQGTPISEAVPQEGSLLVETQLLYQIMMLFIPLPSNVMMHPMAFAAWVGFLVTGINLLPAGQLDGGHVARGFLGDKAKFLSYAAMGALMFMGFFFYSGWLIFGLLILFLGLRHPQPLNDISKINTKHKVLGALAIIMLIGTFLPVPLTTVAADYTFDIDAMSTAENVTAGGTVYFPMTVENIGNTNYSVKMVVSGVSATWGRGIYLTGDETNATDTLVFSLPYETHENVVLKLIVPSNADVANRTITVSAVAIDSDGNVMYTAPEQSFIVRVVA